MFQLRVLICVVLLAQTSCVMRKVGEGQYTMGFATAREKLISVNDEVNEIRKLLVTQVGVDLDKEAKQIDEVEARCKQARAGLTDDLKSEAEAYKQVDDNLTDVERFVAGSKLLVGFEREVTELEDAGGSADRAKVDALKARIAKAQKQLHENWRNVANEQQNRLERMVADADRSQRETAEKTRRAEAAAEDAASRASGDSVELRTDKPLPGPGAGLTDRSVRRYFRWPKNEPPRDELARQLFTQAPKELFVYAAEAVKTEEGRSIKRGEAMLIVEAVNDRSTSYIDVLTVDGLLRNNISPKVLSAMPVGRTMDVKPADLAVMNGSRVVRTSYDLEFDQAPDFLPLLGDGDKDRAKFLADQKKAIDCYDRERKRLDPDGIAGKYDLVTYGRNGETKKVESYLGKIERQINKSCKLDDFLKRRDALEARVFSHEKARRYEELQPLMTRVRQLLE